MPHIPRHPPPSGVDPSMTYRPRPTQRPIPLPDAPPQEEAAKKRLKIGMAKISPHTFEPDRASLLRIMLGKDPNDEFSFLVPSGFAGGSAEADRPGR